ncbi:MAG: hypothetical protein ABJC09_03915 [Terriglobia bacterium]
MRVFEAGLYSAIAAIAIGWLIVGRLFDRFQSRNPSTWRDRSWRLRVGGILVNDVFFGFAFSGFFFLVGGIGRFNIDNWIGNGLAFGVGCWAAVACPMCLSILVFMRVHKGVVIGMLLDWLASSIAAGLICGYLLGR